MDKPTCGFYRWVETEDGEIAAECECGWQTLGGDTADSWIFEFQMHELGQHVMEAWA